MSTNNHFQNQKVLFIRWIILCLVTIAIEYYSCYKVFVQKGEISKSYFSISPDKEAAHYFTCQYEIFHIIITSVLILTHINEIFEEILLYLNSRIGCMAKLLFVNKFVFNSCFLMVHISFLIQIDNFSDIIINFGGLMLINQF